MAWRNCNASMSLVAAINAKWPGRDKSSDGTIGDAAHATRTSDHNPWVVVNGVGVVRARDIDKDGIGAAWLAEELRKLGAAGDSRLRQNGYVIFNRRITTPDFRGWKVYNGSNPHDKHVHVSFSTDRAGFDRTDGWAFLTAAAPAAPAQGGNVGDRMSQRGEKDSDVLWAQQRLNYWGYKVAEDSDFGPATEEAAKAFQRDHGLEADGIIGERTRTELAKDNQPWLGLPAVRSRARSFQAWYNAYPFKPALLPVIKPLADNFGPQSESALRKVQARYGLVADGIDGPATKKLLWDLGWRG